jgi:hypothetical protein
MLRREGARHPKLDVGYNKGTREVDKIGSRKMRSDKKVDVKPTISDKTKRQVYKFSELCELPVKDVAQQLIEIACTSSLILEEINQWFRRDYVCPPAIHKGDIDRPRLKIISNEETGKLNTRLSQENYDQLCDLSYSIDLPPTTTAAILIKRTLHNREFMFDYVRSLKHINDEQKNVIHAFLRKIWGFR